MLLENDLKQATIHRESSAASYYAFVHQITSGSKAEKAEGSAYMFESKPASFKADGIYPFI